MSDDAVGSSQPILHLMLRGLSQECVEQSDAEFIKSIVSLTERRGSEFRFTVGQANKIRRIEKG